MTFYNTKWTMRIISHFTHLYSFKKNISHGEKEPKAFDFSLKNVEDARKWLQLRYYVNNISFSPPSENFGIICHSTLYMNDDMCRVNIFFPFEYFFVLFFFSFILFEKNIKIIFHAQNYCGSQSFLRLIFTIFYRNIFLEYTVIFCNIQRFFQIEVEKSQRVSIWMLFVCLFDRLQFIF